MKFKEWLQVTGVCVLVLAGVAAWAFVYTEAYDGDMSCLVIKCVKIKR